MPSNLILCHPPFLPSIFPSIRFFSIELTLHIRWPNYWSFSFSISPSNEYSRLIFFRIDWFDILLSQGLSRIFSNIIIQKHQFIDTHPSLTQSSVLAWRIPRMVEAGGMLSMGLHRIGHDWSNLAAAAAPFFYGPTLTSTHGHWKALSLTIRIFVGK